MIRPAHIDYLLDQLDEDERAEVEGRAAGDPDEAADLDRLRATLAMLEADREAAIPRAGLTDRTLARLTALFSNAPPCDPGSPESLDGVGVDLEPATRIAASDLPTPVRRTAIPTDRPELRGVGGRFRGDLAVACGIGLIAIGLTLSFVNRVRHANDVMACQRNLLTLHQGLSGYADTHGDRFPEVGTPAYPTAGSFATALTDAGQCPPGFQPGCPAGTPAHRRTPPVPVTYTYSLGHRTAVGTVLGICRSQQREEENDLLPIASDYPVASVAVGNGSASPHTSGHNVLYVAGNVRFASSATVGINGDDIYRNQRGQVAAGLARDDTVLGAAWARP